MKKSAFYLVSLLIVTSFAQQPDSANSVEQLKKADFLLGDWKGTGWMNLPGDQKTILDQTYFIQAKLNGTLILVESERTFLNTEKDEPDATLESLWILTWKGWLNRFDVVCFKEDGTYELAITDFPEPNRMTWESKHPILGSIRYAFTLDSAGSLVQTGEIPSCDSLSWDKIIEIELKK